MGDDTLTVVFRDHLELPALEVVVGETRVPLGVEPLVVGTHVDCDVVLSDPRTSRRHCRLSVGARGVCVEDLSSKNGTLVNGVQVDRAWVSLNVPILVGDTRLVVRPLGGTVDVPLSVETRFGEAIGASVAMRALFARLERAAGAELTVLLLGESGTGKELLAHALHTESPRRDGPFIPFDCASVPSNLLEAELFGYVRGAFTGANADRRGILAESNGGTLFLDEIGELPLDLQPKILRALESHEYRPVGARSYVHFDARVVAATHRPLRQAAAKGAFRQDLYYRLAVLEVRVPPLRERPEDIELLVERFLSAQSPPRSIRDLPAGSLAMLRAHAWPGNVRELRNAVSRLLLFPELGESAYVEGDAPPAPSMAVALPLQLGWREAREKVVEHFERAYVVAKLTQSGGNVSRAADSMGVSRQFVHQLMARYDVRRSDAK